MHMFNDSQDNWQMSLMADEYNLYQELWSKEAKSIDPWIRHSIVHNAHRLRVYWNSDSLLYHKTYSDCMLFWLYVILIVCYSDCMLLWLYVIMIVIIIMLWLSQGLITLPWLVSAFLAILMTSPSLNESSVCSLVL